LEKFLVDESRFEIGKKHDLSDSDSGKCSSSLFLSHPAIDFPAAIFLPEVRILGRAIRCVNNHWLVHPLQQATASDALIVGMSDQHEGSAQQLLEVGSHLRN
jgi:hypothetical protein